MRRKNRITWAAGAVLALSLAGCVWAMPAIAAETDMEETEITQYAESLPQISWKADSEIEDGILTIRIESSEYANPEFWWQDSLFDKGDASIVGLAKMTETEGFAYWGDYHVLEGADQDGEDTIRLVYTNGHYTSEYMEWTVSVEDGKIKEVIGGGQAFASSAADFAPVLEGVWQEEDGTKTLEIQLDDNNSLEFTIVDENGKDGNRTAYRMHAYYDTEKMTLVYWDGIEYPADSVEEISTDAVDPENAGTGVFGVFPASADSEDETDLVITWQDNTFGNNDNGTFVRAES